MAPTLSLKIGFFYMVETFPFCVLAVSVAHRKALLISIATWITHEFLFPPYSITFLAVTISSLTYFSQPRSYFRPGIANWRTRNVDITTMTFDKPIYFLHLKKKCFKDYILRHFAPILISPNFSRNKLQTKKINDIHTYKTKS